MMKSSKFTVVLAVFLAAALLGLAAYSTGIASAVVAGQPGSTDDPLVTKSWVEAFVQQKISSVPAAPAGGSMVWEIKELVPGEVFLGQAGTEFVVRSGRAVVVDPTGSGIPNFTTGTNVAAGMVAAPNNLFCIPRSDGRGIRAETGVIVMFRGGSA